VPFSTVGPCSMKYLLELEPLPCLQNVIIQDLKDLGAKVDLTKKDVDQPSIKKSKSKEDSLVSVRFYYVSLICQQRGGFVKSR
jgi:hypothetical protein